MQTLRLFASLTLEGPFTELIPPFEAAHPEVTIAPSFGACSSLVQSMMAGAEADIFSASSLKIMEDAHQKGLVAAGPWQKLARLPLALVVNDRDHTVQRPEDLLRTEVRTIAISDPDTVAPGRCARMALVEAGLWDQVQHKLKVLPDPYQPMLHVASGKADAGFVFGTTAANSGGAVRVAVDFPISLNMDYPIAVTQRCQCPEAAKNWLEFMQTQAARDALIDAGFAID